MVYGWIIFGIAVVLGFGLLLLISKPRGLSSGDQEKIRQMWSNIELLVEGDNESEWVKAIFEADKLLDYALTQRRATGNNLGERLKNSRGLFRNVEPAWAAHKLRNELAHNLDTQLTRPQVERAMNNFQQALKQLGAL